MSRIITTTPGRKNIRFTTARNPYRRSLGDSSAYAAAFNLSPTDKGLVIRDDEENSSWSSC